MSGDAAPSHRTVETLRALQSQFATDITEELAVDLLSHLHILQHTLLQQLQSARARRNAGGGYNGGRRRGGGDGPGTSAIRAP